MIYFNTSRQYFGIIMLYKFFSKSAFQVCLVLDELLLIVLRSYNIYCSDEQSLLDLTGCTHTMILAI